MIWEPSEIARMEDAQTLLRVMAGVVIGRTGLQANLTCYVLAYAALQYLTEQNLVDCFLVNACTLDSCLGSSGAKLGGGYIAEGAAVSADCGTGSGTDVNVHLAVSPFLLMRRKTMPPQRLMTTRLF